MIAAGYISNDEANAGFHSLLELFYALLVEMVVYRRDIVKQREGKSLREVFPNLS